jgi:hypothetical protein
VHCLNCDFKNDYFDLYDFKRKNTKINQITLKSQFRQLLLHLRFKDNREITYNYLNNNEIKVLKNENKQLIYHRQSANAKSFAQKFNSTIILF